MNQLDISQSNRLELQRVKLRKRKLELEREKRKREKRRIFQKTEFLKCAKSYEYFIETYCKIYDTSDPDNKIWIDFSLWDEQKKALKQIGENQQTIVLKARQNGLSWLGIAYALWQMIFKPIATVLMFSLRDNEARALIGDERMYGMYKRLPEFLRVRIVSRNTHFWRLENGSTVTALPTTAGDSYTATFALVDEADLVPDLNMLLQRVKPTIDAGGKLTLISRSDKTQPQSDFKKIYRAAKENRSKFVSVFLPWHARPSRTREWYEAEKKSNFETYGNYDNIFESYPETDSEALAPSEGNRRIPYTLLKPVINNSQPLDLAKMAHTFPNFAQTKTATLFAQIPTIELFEEVNPYSVYRIGVDTAEGNPTSDDSSISAVELTTGREVALVNGKFEPKLTAQYAHALSLYLNGAYMLVERNNHGHAVLLALEYLRALVLLGDDKKRGWLDTRRGKVILYDNLAEVVTKQNCEIRSFKTSSQISQIEGTSLSAPKGENDDIADSYALAQLARTLSPPFSAIIAQGKAKGW